MTKKHSVLKTAFIVFSCGLIIFLIAYIYLYFNLKNNEQTAEVKKNDVPYSATSPQNTGLLFKFPDNSGCMVYLDFSSQMIYATVIDDCKKKASEYYGYSVDFTVNSDYYLISAIIDRIGGIELNITGEELRYTGIQITDIISSKTDIAEIRKEIIRSVFKEISKNGFSKDDFVYIIENSDTDLTVPDCFFWEDYIKEMSLRCVLTN